MTRRWARNLCFVLLMLLIVAVGLALGAVLATAAPMAPNAYSTHVRANAYTAQERTDDVAAWMRSVLRAEIEPRVVEVGTENPANVGEATTTGVLRLAPEYAGDGPRALYTRLHELAHRPANAACWGVVDDEGTMSPDRRTEEGIADALTKDLMPAALRRFAPGQWFVSVEVGDYGAEVASVRYAVRRLTGGRGWGRAERLMLRALWAADCDGRAALLEEAGR